MIRIETNLKFKAVRKNFIFIAEMYTVKRVNLHKRKFLYNTV